MEKGNSFLEVVVLSAIICMALFSGLEILLKGIELKNKSAFRLFLNNVGMEKIEEIKDCIKKEREIEKFEDFVREPFTKGRVLRRWEVKEIGNLVGIKVIVFPIGKEERRVELSDYFWKRGGF